MEEHEEFFRDFCENAHDLIQSVSPDGRILYVNRAWRETLGYAPEELERLNLFDVIHPDCREHCRAIMAEVVQGREPQRIEAVFVAKDGRRVQLEGSASCRFENGRPVSTRAIFRDVTEHRVTLQELDRLFTLAMDLMCVAGTDGYFRRVNPAFEKLLGYSAAELTSRQFVEFIHPDDVADTLAAVERLAEGLPVVDFQNRYRTRAGDFRWLAWRATPWAEAQLIYAVARDITERKQAEATMARQAAELARSNADLEQFAYAASHDLRAPLRAVAHLAGWIEEELPENASAELREHLDKLKRRVGRMETLTDDLLRYSRAGRPEDQRARVDVAALVADLATLLASPAGLVIRAEPGLPVFETTAAGFEQVLRNLLNNAIKHHDKAAGTITVSATEQDDTYEFSVRDDGPGVPAEFRDRMFQMFQRLHPRAAVEGTGMGLALVQRIVEGHGGRVWLEPGEGRGADFRFTWPKRIPSFEERDGDDPDR